MVLSKNLDANAKAVAEFLELMGNEKRLLIMNHLAGAELSVGILAERVQLSQSALSKHLAKLRVSGLVGTRRDGQMVYYFCSSGAARELITMLESYMATERPLAGPRYVAERLRRWRSA